MGLRLPRPAGNSNGDCAHFCLSVKRLNEYKMTRQIILLCLLAVLTGNFSCNNSADNKTLDSQSNQQNMIVTIDTLKQILNAFNRHDLDAIMGYFSDNCSFDFPRGPEHFGQRFVGKARVREALASRFKGIPDVHYGEDRHWISSEGDRGVSEWTLTGTTTSGVRVKVRGCDLWEFADGKIIRKDSYWKIVEPASNKPS